MEHLTKDVVQEQIRKSVRSLMLVVNFKNTYICMFCKSVRASENVLSQA